MLFNSPRNWKWMVPAALIAPVMVWWNKWVMLGGEWQAWSVVPLVLMGILGVAALINLYLYVQSHWSEMYADVQAARNSTPEVRMFEAAKGMHPEAVKALLTHRRTIWRLKYIPAKDLVDWIFDDAESVHAGFVDFVLDRSSHTSVMPKRLLSEGSRQFDPEGLITDYEQYDALILLWQQKLMVTQAYGNQAPQWMPPWNPELVRHRFGLDGLASEELFSDQSFAVSPASGVFDGQRVTESALRSPLEVGLDGLDQTQAMKAATDRMLNHS